MSTVLITGTSSGIGKATAKHFQQQGWNVVATMRKPETEEELTQLDNTLVTCLDVLDESSIASAVDESIARFGRIDALVNNAGYGAYGPLEAWSMDGIRRQFDTNVIGLLATTKAVIPHMRANKAGVIANVGSVVGKVAFPLGSLYSGTKFAVEGITEALNYELPRCGIALKLIEPGAIATDFGGRSLDFTNDESLDEYQNVVQALTTTFEQGYANATPASVVAEVIYGAVTDGTDTLRYTVGDDAELYLTSRAQSDDATFFAGIRQQLGI